MKKTILILLILSIIPYAFAEDQTIVNGHVYHNGTSITVPNWIVNMTCQSQTYTSTTNSAGSYALIINNCTEGNIVQTCAENGSCGTFTVKKVTNSSYKVAYINVIKYPAPPTPPDTPPTTPVDLSSSTNRRSHSHSVSTRHTWVFYKEDSEKIVYRYKKYQVGVCGKEATCNTRYPDAFRTTYKVR